MLAHTIYTDITSADVLVIAILVPLTLDTCTAVLGVSTGGFAITISTAPTGHALVLTMTINTKVQSAIVVVVALCDRDALHCLLNPSVILGGIKVKHMKIYRVFPSVHRFVDHRVILRYKHFFFCPFI
jgi:hypothetical protein